MNPHRSHRTRRVLATLAAAGGLAALLPGSAAAAAIGSTTIDVGGVVARDLRAQGVKIAAGRPARRAGAELTLPVSGGVVGASAAIDHRGAIVLRKRADGKTRKVKLTALQAQLGGTGSTVTAQVGRRRVTVFSIAVPRRRLQLRPADGSARVSAATLRLTRPGARLIRTRLALRSLKPGVIGRLAVAAVLDVPPGRAQQPGGGGAPGPGGGTQPQPQPQPQRCQQSPVVVGQLPAPPEPLARPATAVDVGGAAITWTALDTWIRYVNTGDGALLGGGATAGEPRLNGGTTPLVYDFHFAAKPGSWYDPASGAARLLFGGSVRFLYTSHAIDYAFKDPEVEMTPTGQSRVIFTVSGSECTNFGDTRTVFSTVAWSAATESDGGTRLAFAERQQLLGEGGAVVYGGMYALGDPWGSVAVSFARP